LTETALHAQPRISNSARKIENGEDIAQASQAAKPRHVNMMNAKQHHTNAKQVTLDSQSMKEVKLISKPMENTLLKVTI